MTQMTEYEIATQISANDDARNSLFAKKRELEIELEKLRNEVRVAGTLPQSRYGAICERQVSLRRKINLISEEAANIKTETRRLLAAKDQARQRRTERRLIEFLRDLRFTCLEHNTDFSRGIAADIDYMLEHTNA